MIRVETQGFIERELSAPERGSGAVGGLRIDRAHLVRIERLLRDQAAGKLLREGFHELVVHGTKNGGWRKGAERLGLAGGRAGLSEHELSVVLTSIMMAGEVLGELYPFQEGMALAAGALLADGTFSQQCGHVPKLLAGVETSAWAPLESRVAGRAREVTVRRDGDVFVLNGVTRAVTTRCGADLLVLGARLTESQGREPGCYRSLRFLVDGETPGVEQAVPEDVAGVPMGAVVLSQARIPRERMLGPIAADRGDERLRGRAVRAFARGCLASLSLRMLEAGKTGQAEGKTDRGSLGRVGNPGLRG